MRSKTMVAAAIAVLVSLLGLFPAGPATPAQAAGMVASPNLRHVANVQWRSGGAQMGTDIELATIRGRDYALGGTYNHGLQIVDVTDPARPKLVSTYPCPLVQGDVQVFRQGSRTLATYTADNGYGSGSGRCFRDVPGDGRYGTFIVDVSDPAKPRTVSFLSIPRGSHNMTVHPSGQWLFNSDAELTRAGQVEVWDIRRPELPKLAVTLPFASVSAVNTALASAHDITFSRDGKRAYVAALTHTLVLDTSYPGAPEVIGRIVDPAVNIHHQADPVVLKDAAGVARTFLVVSDELTGGSDNVYCPGGGLHVYEVTGPLEAAPVKTGAFFIPDTFVGPNKGRCTSHVLRMHDEHRLMTIAWYAAGVRVVDLGGLVGLSAGADPAAGSLGAGMREVAFARFPNSETWSAKTNRINRDGSFHLFANDLARGIDVFRFDPDRARRSADPGEWLDPAAALERARATVAPAGAAYGPGCVILEPRG